MGSSGVGDEVNPEAPRLGEDLQGSSPTPSPSPPTPPEQQSPQDTSTNQPQQEQQEEADSNPSNDGTPASPQSQEAVESPSSSSASERPQGPLMCSIIRWDITAAENGRQQPPEAQKATCERTHIRTPDDLRDEVASLLTQREDSPAADETASSSSSATNTGLGERRQQGQQKQGPHANQRRPLITLLGARRLFIRTLLDSPLGIDPAFAAAHVQRRRYRPGVTNRGRGERAAHWDYPELVGGYGRMRGLAFGPPDGAVVRPVSDVNADLAAMFCRASLWGAEGVNVLLLDGPERWLDRNPLWRVTWRGGIAGEGATVGRSWVFRPKRSEEAPGLEEAFEELLGSGEMGGWSLPDALEEKAFQHWLDFFEVLTPRQETPFPSDRISLEWYVMQALERNTDMSREVARRGSRGSNTTSRPDWEGLTRRLRLRVKMLELEYKPPESREPAPIPRYESSDSSFPKRYSPVAQRTRLARSPAAESSGIGKPSPSIADEDQRSIDRVTYLGGILLPFTVVAGVLSMNDIFEPGGRLFWVFWVASIPLAAFTVLLIFIDKLSQRLVEPPDKSGHGTRDKDKMGKLPPRPGLPPRRGAVRHSAAPNGHVDLEMGTPTPPGYPAERLHRLSDDEESALHPERALIVSHSHGHRLPPGSLMPGAPADDVDFAATLAAGLEGAGFDPNIVVEDATHHRRESPSVLSVAPPPPPVFAAPPPPPRVFDAPSRHERESQDDSGYTPVVIEERSEDEDVPGSEAPRPRIQRLGWGGAVLSILGVRKPVWVSGSNPESAIAEAYRRRQRRTKRRQ